MPKTRVLIVDDSLFMRKLIENMLSQDSRIEVAGIAKNGKEALEKIENLKPDVVTLDVEMPEINGLETLKRIMLKNPLPVIMISNLTMEGAEKTVQAFQLGAYDFIAKPSSSSPHELIHLKEELIDKIIKAKSSNLAILTNNEHHFHNMAPEAGQRGPDVSLGKGRTQRKKLVLIGASTGGPRALQVVLSNLPKNLEAPILIVQHMPSGFTRSLAERLNNISDITVKEAENGEILKNGTAYIAPGGYHLLVRKTGKSVAAEINADPPYNSHRPSVDKLFLSAARLTDYDICAVILTGMGNDGAKGLAGLKQKTNTYALSESEETAVIFGMPKAAIQTGLIDEIIRIEQIPTIITNKINAG